MIADNAARGRTAVDALTLAGAAARPESISIEIAHAVNPFSIRRMADG